jgi:hypothetical protein
VRETSIDGTFGKGQRLPNIVAQRRDRVTQTVVACCMAECLQTFIGVIEGRDIKTKAGKEQCVTALASAKFQESAFVSRWKKAAAFRAA